MREGTLARFFVGDVAIDRVAEEVAGAVTRLDSVNSTIAISDMDGVFPLTREHIILLSNAKLLNELTSEALSTIAFALLASDQFEWDDAIISEVLLDWSCPEVNFSLTDGTLRLHQDCLNGAANPPVRATVPTGHLISRKEKGRV